MSSDQLFIGSNRNDELTDFTQRCVIVQRDEKGFGLRVSGQAPVFVESVKTDGAAYKAGVRAGDRIIKVNGTLVTNQTHAEVVKLIQDCGSYVGLTLLGLKESEIVAATTTTTSTATTPVSPESNSKITAPLPANDSTLLEFELTKEKTIKMMIEKEIEFLRKVPKEGADSTLGRIRRLEEQLSTVRQHIEKISDLSSPPSRQQKRASKYNQRRHLSAENLNYYLKGRKGVEKKDEDPTAKKSHSFGQYDHKIISMEDEEEDGENRDANSSVEDLASKETVLRFLTFLVNQRHSLSSTLFLLLLRFYRESVHSAHPLVARKWVFELCSTFLYPDSPLSFGSGAADMEELNRIDHFLTSEEDETASLYKLFTHFEQKAKQVSRRLMDLYQQQQTIGLGLEIQKITSASLQHLVATPFSEQTEFANLSLIDSVDAILNGNSLTASIAPGQLSVTLAQVVCLATVVRRLFPQQMTKEVKKTPAFLESKMPPLSSSSFSTPSSASSDPQQGHQFLDHASLSIVYCSGCGQSHWGFFGKQCTQCQLNAHPWCLKQVADESTCVVSSVSSSRKQRSANKWRSSGGRIVDNIWKRITSEVPNERLLSADDSAIPEYSSSSSSDSDEDSRQTVATIVVDQEDEDYDVISHPEPNIAPPSPPAPTPPPPLPPRNNSDERKRSDIIKELFDTERTYLRNLRLLHHFFYRPMKSAELMSNEQLAAVFCNHESLYRIHSEINRIFRKLRKARRKDIGKDLLQIFSGSLGSRLETESAKFCSQQANGGQAALRQKMKKDSKLATFLSEVETLRTPNRLGLKDLLASCFQRITKYPLLLESLMKVTSDPEERSLVEGALNRSKEILRQVNESVKRAESVQRLLQIEKALLTPPPESLRGKQLVLEGDLVWRITKQKQIEVRAVLTDDLLLLLTREEASRTTVERYQLKPQTNPITRIVHAPLLHVSHLLTRDIATDARAFFLVSTKENALYEFAASSASERRTWTAKIEELVRAGVAEEVENNAVSVVVVKKEEEEEERGGRVEGSIRLVTSDEEEEEGEFNEEPILATVVTSEEALIVKSDEERLAEIDGRIAEALEEKRRLLMSLMGVDSEGEWRVVQDVGQETPIGEKLAIIDSCHRLVAALALERDWGAEAEEVLEMLSRRRE